MPQTATIYGLLDPRTTELRYVGKTISPDIRAAAHKSGHGNNRKKVAWVKELAMVGLEPKFIIFSEVPFEEWKKQERETIARYRKLGCPLLNVHAGCTDKVRPLGQEYVSFTLEGQDALALRQYKSEEIIDKNAVAVKKLAMMQLRQWRAQRQESVTA